MTEEKYKQRLVVVLIIAIVLVGGAYYAGVKHGTNKAAALRATAMSGMRGGGRFAGGTGGLVTGTVLSKDATSVTIQSRDGSSKIVLYSASTQVLKSASGAASDITVGQQVSAQGTQNSDGSVTATSIQIRPTMPTTAPVTPAVPTNSGQ